MQYKAEVMIDEQHFTKMLCHLCNPQSFVTTFLGPTVSKQQLQCTASVKLPLKCFNHACDIWLLQLVVKMTIALQI